jgi:hypothetical protein
MAQATLGFSGAIRACAHGNLCPQTGVQISMGTGHGLGITHGFKTSKRDYYT